MTEPIDENVSQTELVLYFNWLKKIIALRMHAKEDADFYEIISSLPIPKGTKNSLFQDIVKELNLSGEEQLIVLLSLAPYFIPEFINSITQINDNKAGRDLFFNKSLINKSIYPSIETAISLLGGSDIECRQKYFHHFGINSKLFKEDLIAQPSPPHGEPFTRSTLAPGHGFLNNMIMGENKGPEFSHDFPATLITSDYSWDELILDYDTRSQLQEVKEWIDYEDKCREKGIQLEKFKGGYKCLFFGPPGTGKTLAASLIGKLTHKKVYRIDLSAVVSKYIGETEKNLSKIFDRASHGNWILFFDEADALFGKRGTTQNAHDRYANQEVSYLLQRFENYEGVSILASNFKDNIDVAFYRRFHSIVRFKNPEFDERMKLWEIHLPKGFTFAPDVDLPEIARSVKINGAGIYNVMRRSCMKAVLNNTNIIQGQDMLDSVKMEFSKENKLI
ncbi:MAG TPA: ATP-binding protein [Bacteroidales bacterium]|nr:ATP-binding protein [Bacteroidales bacterium]